MADENSNGQMTWFERHVVDSLERLEDNAKATSIDFRKHTEADAIAFESIRTEIATSKAERNAVARTTSKLWAGVGAVLSLLVSLLVHFFAHK